MGWILLPHPSSHRILCCIKSGGNVFDAATLARLLPLSNSYKFSLPTFLIRKEKTTKLLNTRTSTPS
ncbi:hypothetical protein I7I50_07392 [Histoplasma capsulatum G186AR]|uniref:Uncharacterized protein n=1 Tax=Ajellomyces capsulatus TaxID=5037 RepID=A0A8H7Z136_AJECA|nr:hypothetical protein I7I52_09536 [Histoplasma capsulatum]QSS68100.1 hypothetical protein I7I50_07392 [Histoplasma capsulatum G186AR]